MRVLGRNMAYMLRCKRGGAQGWCRTAGTGNACIYKFYPLEMQGTGMKPKMILKLAVDIGMTAALLLLAWHMSWSDRQPMNGSALECLSFCHPPYLKRQLDQKPSKREIQSCAHHADRTCIIDTLRNGRLNGKRNYPVPSCAVFFFP